ncbi:MAG: G2-specific serine/threonine protein kinase [Ramalina farinacea]|uniref:non-specific serine/threonine protein kinase n=1 Tax=Ramalina farinacea TaxID=258253 RepID=A0AA43QRS9_9LECA|nr:G2-specific serine/threonine protein kinase [Ramalina farinacea]
MLAFASYEKLPDKERYVGGGRFGYVEKVRRKPDAKILACKTIRFKDIETSKAVVERECEILKQLNHPNIVQQVEVAWRSHKVKIYMEYCEGGSLQDLINDRKKEGTLLSEKYVWTVAYQLASALLYCHFGLRVNDEGHVSSDPNNILPWTTILHRDIKPANVFMMNHSETALDSIKLGDFGLGQLQAHIERTRQKGVQDPMLLGSDKSRNKNPSTGNTLVKLNDSILVEQVIAQVEQVIAKAEQVIAEADEREQGRIAASNHLERTRPVAAADQQVHMTATVLAKTDEPITVSNRDETPSTCQIM